MPLAAAAFSAALWVPCFGYPCGLVIVPRQGMPLVLGMAIMWGIIAAVRWPRRDDERERLDDEERRQLVRTLGNVTGIVPVPVRVVQFPRRRL